MKRRHFLARCLGALLACFGVKAAQHTTVKADDVQRMFNLLRDAERRAPAMFWLFDGNGKAHLARGTKDGEAVILCETRGIFGGVLPAYHGQGWWPQVGDGNG